MENYMVFRNYFSPLAPFFWGEGGVGRLAQLFFPSSGGVDKVPAVRALRLVTPTYRTQKFVVHSCCLVFHSSSRRKYSWSLVQDLGGTSAVITGGASDRLSRCYFILSFIPNFLLPCSRISWRWSLVTFRSYSYLSTFDLNQCLSFYK
jgi:hypothetical protein